MEGRYWDGTSELIASSRIRESQQNETQCRGKSI